jgi:uncharacterized membrane protein YbaN (DUF454 family)
MDLRPTTDPIRSFLYVAGGWLCVGLAVVGAVLPLVPTTPFLLLASWCFYRGSPRIHAWLHRSKWFGPTLDDWQHYHGVRRTMKRRAVLMVAAVVGCSLLLNSLPWWLRYIALRRRGRQRFRRSEIPTGSPGTEWHAQQVGHPPRLLHPRRSPAHAASSTAWQDATPSPAGGGPPRKNGTMPCFS